MASVKELVYVLRHTGLVVLLKRVYSEVNKDNVFTNAAAMAYAWVFAVFPMLIFLMTLVPYLPQRYRDATPERIGDMMYGAGLQYAYVGPVKDAITKLMESPHGGLLSFGLILTLYAASGGMNTTMASLDTALDIEKGRPFWLKRLLAMALTVFVGVCFLIIVVMLPLGSMATNLLTTYAHKLPDWVSQWITAKTVILTTVVRYAIGLTVMQIMIGVIYQVGPSRWHRLKFFTVGSIFTALGWIATGFVLRFYFAHFNSYDKTYGAVAGMVIMLMVFYLDAMIILIGAELDNEVMKARYETPKESA
jgi:membrane protein